MKSSPAFLTMLLCICFAFTSTAQNGNNAKPKLFENLPSKIDCNSQDLERLFSKATGQTASISFQSNFIFNGVVSSNIQQYSNLQTILIKSSQLDNTLLNISKATNADGTVEYSGYIINQKYYDGYQIANVAGNYSLSKIATDNTLHVCKQ